MTRLLMNAKDDKRKIGHITFGMAENSHNTAQKIEMLTAHHWLQGSTRTVRVQWSDQETKNQDCTDL